MEEIRTGDGFEDRTAKTMLHEARRLAHQLEFLHLKSGLPYNTIEKHIAAEANYNPHLIDLAERIIRSWYQD